MVTAFLVVNLIFLGYSLLAVGMQVILLVAAGLELRREVQLTAGDSLRRLVRSPVTPTITVLAPAYNEEANIAHSVRSLLTLHYPRLQVVVVNDGSADGTMDVLHREFDLVEVAPPGGRTLQTARVRAVLRSQSAPGLLVLDKENGGKADALNAALDVASGDLVCAIDADTLIEPDALLRVVRPFLGDAGVVAAGGSIRVANDATVRHGQVETARVPGRPVAGIQVVEYLRAFHLGRLGWNRLGGNLIVSGAFGLFRRTEVVAAGGYLTDTVGEDMELVVRLRRRGVEHDRPAKVVFVPDPVAWTEVPETVRVLGRQRDRWQRGLADVIGRHRRLVANPRYRTMGLLTMPYFVIVELLGPVIEALGVLAVVVGLALGAVEPAFAAVVLLVGYGFAVPIAMAAVLMDQLAYRRYDRVRDRALLLLWAAAENLGYRQLAVWWRLRGLLRHAKGRREWGDMTRRGLGT